MHTNVQDAIGDDIVDNHKVTDFGEVDQTPLVINVESKRVFEEVGNEKGEDVEKGE